MLFIDKENGVYSMHYESKQKEWESRSSIRSRPRRIIPEEEQSLIFYPIARQPLCIHPLIVKLGEEAKIYILTQSAYKFMHEVSMLETEVVNRGALIVSSDKIGINFPLALRHDALTVIIDEAYHAYVALDFMLQVEKKTKIKPLEMPKSAPIMDAIDLIKTLIPEHMHTVFELVAVCIGEHVLTKELITIGKDKSLGKTFTEVMADHVIDEGRHANMFDFTLAFLWANLPEDYRLAIGPKLPDFILAYMSEVIQKAFDTQILIGLGLNDDQIQEVINDTYIQVCNAGLLQSQVSRNLVKMLSKCGVLSHVPTLKSFENLRLIESVIDA